MAGRDEIIAAARAAGVVGARDGIPTHIKLQEPTEAVIANGCECEPLVFSDKHLLLHHIREVISGLELAMTVTGARRGVIAYVKDGSELDETVHAEAEKHPGIDVFDAPSFYPIGDEHTLTYEVTGRVAASSGTPASVGVNVFSVDTHNNPRLAAGGDPVTHRTVTVAGEVARPKVMRMPLGARISDAIERAGGATVSSFRVLLGGPVSGILADDVSLPITKSAAAMLILPTHHIQIQKRARSLAMTLLRARSVCFQCRDCTDHCTRHLMGQAIEPHKVMRAICYSLDSLNTSITSAVNCGECGVCDSFVCKMGISPREVCRQIKAHLEAMGFPKPPQAQPGEVSADYASRHIYMEALRPRLGIEKYVAAIDLQEILHGDAETGFAPPESLAVPLLQHVGAPALPTVTVGDAVQPGQLIGEIPEGKTGARVHTGLGGTVKAVDRHIEIDGAGHAEPAPRARPGSNPQ